MKERKEGREESLNYLSLPLLSLFWVSSSKACSWSKIVLFLCRKLLAEFHSLVIGLLFGLYLWFFWKLRYVLYQIGCCLNFYEMKNRINRYYMSNFSCVWKIPEFLQLKDLLCVFVEVDFCLNGHIFLVWIFLFGLFRSVQF